MNPELLRLRRRQLLALAAAAASPLGAAAQAAVALRLIVPFTPGTGIDIIARQLAAPLSARLGRPVVIENRPGASGNLGTEAVVRAAPDGNTLLVTVSTLVMNRALYPKLGFDPLRDLEPVSMTSWGQLLLCTSKASGLTTAAALIARARAAPGVLNYASPGNGTPHHLAMELLKNKAGIFITHIPYRGTAPALTDLLGGQVDVAFMPIHVALPHVRAGRLNALAISSSAPHPLLPDVAPLRVLGLGDLNVDMWFGLLAPAGTPRAFVERVDAEIKAALAAPEVATALHAQGMTIAHAGPAEFGALIRRDAERWAAVVKAQGIQPD